MNKLLFIILFSFSFPTYGLNTVKNLDIDRYMGQWFEIASIPQSFSKDCLKNTEAYYEKSNNLIKVTNQCTEAQGKINIAEGRARINKDYNEDSKLEVTFVRFLRRWIWPFGGDYWVIDLDKDYQWSIVSNPDKDTLWILSRTPRMSPNTLKNMEVSLKNKGFDTCAILISLNDNSTYTERTPLCQL